MPYSILLLFAGLLNVTSTSNVNGIDEEATIHDTIPNAKSKPDIKETTLDEFVVKAVTQKDIPGGTAFFPDKRDKKFAYDGMSLLKNMALVELPYDIRSKTVTDASGNMVNFFIDGRPASTKEMNAINPKDVDRIEYLPIPTQAGFGGKNNVVNFITKKYISGGYTKINAREYINGKRGDYDLTSRLVYKEVTYDLFLDGHYRNDNKSGRHVTSDYKDILFDGKLYSKISEFSETGDQTSKNRQLGAMMKITWNHKNVNLLVTPGWNWERVPENSAVYKTHFEPAVFNFDRFKTTNSSLGINPYLKTNLRLSLPAKQMLSISVNAQQANHHYSSVYAPDEAPDLFNGSKNTHNSLFGMVDYSKTLNSKNSLNISGYISYDNSKTFYEGTYEESTRFHNLEEQIKASFSHIFKRGRSLSFSAGVTHTSKVSDGKDVSVWAPTGDLSFINSWNNKSTFRFSSSIFSMGYLSETMNDVILHVRELLWKRGNAKLRERIWWQQSVSNSFNLSSNFSFSLNAGYTTVFHQDMPVWEIFDGLDGVVETRTDHSTQHRVLAGANSTLRLLNRKLVLTGKFNYNYIKNTGTYTNSHSFYTSSFSSTWYGKNWLVGVNITPPGCKYENITRTYNPWIVNLSASFTHKYLSCGIGINPLSSKLKSIVSLDSGHYSTRTVTYDGLKPHSVMIRVTYTLSYGKKVSSTSISSSGMLRSGAMNAE